MKKKIKLRTYYVQKYCIKEKKETRKRAQWIERKGEESNYIVTLLWFSKTLN